MPRRRRRIDLTGQSFGRLTVLRRSANRGGRTRWTCLCECGKKRAFLTQSLRSGDTTSCGCRLQEIKRATYKHGANSNRVYRIWKGMKARCYPPTYSMPNYAGRGITICPEWMDFGAFNAWAQANGYASHLSIDRVDNDRGYSPDNCRWATREEQANNKRGNIVLTLAGERLTATQAARRFGIGAATIVRRLRWGWSAEMAVKRLAAREVSAIRKGAATPPPPLIGQQQGTLE